MRRIFMLQKIREKSNNLLISLLVNQKGMSTMELMMILAGVAIVIGGTIFVANTPITNWWSSKIMSHFS